MSTKATKKRHVKVTKRVNDTEMFKAVLKVQDEKALALAGSLYHRERKDVTPKQMNEHEIKQLAELRDAGFTYRVIEEIAHMTVRNGMSSFNAINPTKKKVKKVVKKTKTVKAKKAPKKTVKTVQVKKKVKAKRKISPILDAKEFLKPTVAEVSALATPTVETPVVVQAPVQPTVQHVEEPLTPQETKELKVEVEAEVQANAE